MANRIQKFGILATTALAGGIGIGFLILGGKEEPRAPVKAEPERTATPFDKDRDVQSERDRLKSDREAVPAFHRIEEMHAQPLPAPVAGNKCYAMRAEGKAYINADRHSQAIITLPAGTEIMLRDTANSEFARGELPKRMDPFSSEGWISKRLLRPAPGGCE